MLLGKSLTYSMPVISPFVFENKAAQIIIEILIENNAMLFFIYIQLSISPKKLPLQVPMM